MDREIEAKQVRDFVARGNYHAAYNIALSAMNACHREGEQDGVDYFIALIREIVDALEDEFGCRPAD